MSDELYFGPPNGHRGHRERRSSDHPYFYDPREDEYEEHGLLEDYSLNDNPRTRPMNIENLRRLMRQRNPDGEE